MFFQIKPVEKTVRIIFYLMLKNTFINRLREKEYRLFLFGFKEFITLKKSVHVNTM
jgi:hypothetical protein